MTTQQSKSSQKKAEHTHQPDLHSHEAHDHHGCCVEHSKIGRNDPCFCGSNKKYKKCCLHIRGQMTED